MSAGGLGVVVLTYGQAGVHEPLLESLAREGVSPCQVVVVHNPSAEGEPDPTVPPGCDLVRAQRNVGYAGGMNLGLKALRHRDSELELVLFLTHDARLRPGALAALLGAARRSDRAGILGPALYESGTEVPFSFGGMTSPAGATAHRKATPQTDEDGVATCDWVDGGTLLVGSEVLASIGAFDERFFAYCEESDLCLRARRARFEVGVVVAAHADQDSGAAKRPGAWAYLNTRNGIAYARRAAGARGLLGGMGRALGQVSLQAARTVVRACGLRPGPAGETWALTIGTLRGLLDYLRGRWGPPPPGLPGIGDIGNA